MSVASDILLRAVEQAHTVRADHVAHVAAQGQALVEALRHPWKFRVDQVEQAVETIRELRPTEEHE